MIAAEAPSRCWSARPWRARTVRLLVYVLPVVLSLAFVHLSPRTGAHRPRRFGSSCSGGWRSAPPRRSSFARLSRSRGGCCLWARCSSSRCVFPDQAPSRFQLALRTGTVASLEERVRLMREAKIRPDRARSRPNPARPGRRSQHSRPHHPRPRGARARVQLHARRAARVSRGTSSTRSIGRP